MGKKWAGVWKYSISNLSVNEFNPYLHFVFFHTMKDCDDNNLKIVAPETAKKVTCVLCYSGCSSASNSHQCIPQRLWEVVNSEPGPWGGTGVWWMYWHSRLCVALVLSSHSEHQALAGVPYDFAPVEVGVRPPASYSHLRNSQQKGPSRGNSDSL